MAQLGRSSLEILKTSSHIPSISEMDGDKMTPVYAFDDTALNRVMPVCQVLRFPDIMDADILRTSLETLLEIGDWKKLRGRWRLDASGKLFIQVPPTATHARAAIRFKHTELAMPIEAHPLVSQIARPRNDCCSVQLSLSSSAKLWPVLVPTEWPQNISDLTDQTADHPILGLHVMSFDNATVVVLNYNHVLMDGGGSRSFMKAWTNVVNGRQADVAPLAGAWSDPLDLVREDIRQNGAERFVLQDRVIDMGDFLPDDNATPVRNPIWDMSSPESRWRVICLTARAADVILKEARATLPSDSFATEDDMIASWVTKTVAGFLPAEQPINLMRVYDLRRALTKAGILEPEAAYIQNMYQMAWTLTPESKDLAEAPLGKIAVGLRSSLSQQTTTSQIRASIKARLDSGMTPLYGDPKGMIFTANSRVKNHDCKKMDFSSAVKCTHVVGEQGNNADGKSLEQAGLPDYIEALVQLPGPPPGPNFIQSAMDMNGNRTICTFLSSAMWPKMKESLKRLDELAESD